MIIPPNAYVQLIDPETGRATSFFTKFMNSLVDALGASGSVPWDPGAIAAGATVSLSVPIPVAAAGSPAAAAFSPLTAGIIPLAFVDAAGSVSAVLWNTTGGIVTPAAGTVTVLVWTP